MQDARRPRALSLVALAALGALAAAQAAALADASIAAPPGPGTTGPSSPLDLALGLTAGLGGIAGTILAIASGLMAFIAAGRAGATSWQGVIAGAAALALAGLMVAAWNLLSHPAPGLHPLVVFAALPLAAGAYALTRPGPLPR